MIKQDSLFLGQFDSILKSNFPSSISVSQLYVEVDENKLPLFSLNSSQIVNFFAELVKEINDILPIIKNILVSPAYIEVEIEKKVRRRCLFRRYKTITEKIQKYDILENKMIADLILKIFWFIESIKEADIFGVKTINRLVNHNSQNEYGFDNFRFVNRVYKGKILKDILDKDEVSLDLKDLVEVLYKEFKNLQNNRFIKYLDAQNISIQNNNILSTNDSYRQCYNLYNKLIDLNCNKFLDKDKTTFLYKEYVLSIMTYLLKKQNYIAKDSTYNFYKKDDDGYKFEKLEFYNDIFNVTIDNYRPMSFDLTFRIRNNITLSVNNKDLEDVVNKMNSPQIKYSNGKLVTRDAVKGPLMRQFVETCKELYGKQDKVELIGIYNKLSKALFEESESSIKLNLKFVVSEKEVLNNKDLTKLTINSAVNNIYNSYDSTIVVTPSKMRPTTSFRKINLNTFTLQNNILEVSPSCLNVVDRLERIVNEATMILEGSNEIYNRTCPICGKTEVRRRETGELTCEDCGSIWALNSINKINTVWLKRIRLK